MNLRFKIEILVVGLLMAIHANAQSPLSTAKQVASEKLGVINEQAEDEQAISKLRASKELGGSSEEAESEESISKIMTTPRQGAIQELGVIEEDEEVSEETISKIMTTPRQGAIQELGVIEEDEEVSEESIQRTPRTQLPANEERALTREVQTDKYMRNSVCLMMMEDASVPEKQILEYAFLNAEWNQKYNNHNLPTRVIDPQKIHLTHDDVAAFNRACLQVDDYLECMKYGYEAPSQTFFNEGSSQNLRNMMAANARTIDTVLQINAARKANRFLIDNRIAMQCAEKWFFDKEGNYTEEVIAERGLLNVSAAEREVARHSAAAQQKLLREIDLDELIGNTFVVVSRFSYKPKEALIEDRMMPLYAAAQYDESGYGTLGLRFLEMTLKASLGAGYYVTVDSYLFRLRWNDEIKGAFFNLWDDQGCLDHDKFMNSNLFSLQFIGNERAWAKTRAGYFDGYSESELIYLAAEDAVDAVLAKFEKKYDQFKTKTPLIVRQDPHKQGRKGRIYGVALGTRDGLKGGEVFEVLEKVVKPQKDGSFTTTYVKHGVLSVNKRHVWDNSADNADTPEEEQMTRLTGKGREMYYEGMLLRLKTEKDEKR